MERELSYEIKCYEDLHRLEHLVVETVLLFVDHELRERNENRFSNDPEGLDRFLKAMAEEFLRSRVFNQALTLSFEQTETDKYSFSQIKIKLCRNLGLKVHDEWIERINGYEFGFLIMIYRHAACCFEANIAHTEERMKKLKICELLWKGVRA